MIIPTHLASVEGVNSEDYASAVGDLLGALLGQTPEGLTITLELTESNDQSQAIFDYIGDIVDTVELSHMPEGESKIVRSSHLSDQELMYQLSLKSKKC